MLKWKKFSNNLWFNLAQSVYHLPPFFFFFCAAAALGLGFGLSAAAALSAGAGDVALVALGEVGCGGPCESLKIYDFKFKSYSKI